MKTLQFNKYLNQMEASSLNQSTEQIINTQEQFSDS